ncbi:hypothetical protein AG1IA_08397 [Rhizoctonia solani AG-1 IA]|uniref:Secreted protein n=1 Tax=Thanatephorus cucumeris (strain AG1-IA) TaxID=983506 RepID=L8WL76_THACA|nr:hypothetical protein AG1IA_08397 [Rhizoctonia solani AG-1 IA]
MTMCAYYFIAFQLFLVVQRSSVFYSFSALNKNAPQPQRATLDFEQNLSDTVSSVMVLSFPRLFCSMTFIVSDLHTNSQPSYNSWLCRYHPID